MQTRFFTDLKTLYSYRDLLLMWTMREIKVRYRQSLMGAGWAILQPLVLMVMFTIVFSVFVRLPSDGVPYPVFAYIALLAWTFFASSLSFAIPTLVNNFNLVTKIYFPREILPVASVGAAFVDFLVASVIGMAMLVWYGSPLSSALIWVPLLIALQVILTLGIVLPLAAINVAHRDIRFVVPLGVQVWLYATPVIYPIDIVPQSVRPMYVLNPMVGIIDAYRRVVLLGEGPNLAYLGISALVSAVLIVWGYIYFKRAEESFADVI